MADYKYNIGEFQGDAPGSDHKWNIGVFQTDDIISGDVDVNVSTLTIALTLNTPTIRIDVDVSVSTLNLSLTLEPPQVAFPIQSVLPATLTISTDLKQPLGGVVNSFGHDSTCKALWSLEPGELARDSIGTNTLTNNGVTEDTADFKQGAGSGDFVTTEEDNLSIADANLNSGVPLKSTESNLSFTYGFWFKVTNTYIGQVLFDKSGETEGIYSIQCWVGGGGRVNIGVSANGTTWNSYRHESVLSDNTWYHVVITRDNSDGAYRFRIHDAAGVVGEDKTGTMVAPYLVNQSFKLGHPSSATLTGNLDEFVIFDRALSVAEIDKIWAGEYGPVSQTVNVDVLSLTATLQTPVISIHAEISVATLELISIVNSIAVEISVEHRPEPLIITTTLNPVQVAFPVQSANVEALALAANLLSAEVAFPVQCVLPETLILNSTLKSPIVSTDLIVHLGFLNLNATLQSPIYITGWGEIPPQMLEALADPYSGGAWIWLVEITIPGYDVIRLARNPVDIVYAGYTYTRHNFNPGLAALSGDGSVPRIMLQVAQDAGYTLEDKINAAHGGCGGTIKIIRTHEEFFTNPVAELEQTISILTAESDTDFVIFSCGIPNPLIRKIPLRRYSSKRCPYALPSLFKETECQYEGEDETCTGKFEDCFTKGNSVHWGGEIGLDPNNTRV